jgi:hypothetical protein
MKMKIAPLTLMVYFLSAPMVWAQISSFQAQGETISFAGHKFKQVNYRSKLGDAWIDDSGLIWGDMVQLKQLSQEQVTTYCTQPVPSDLSGACLMTQPQAIAYCNSIQASLPSKNQFTQLDAKIGNSSNTLDINWKLLVPLSEIEVIPNFFGPDLIYQTSDIRPIDSDPSHTLVYVFQYGTDAGHPGSADNLLNDILNDYPGVPHVVRCVAR